MQSALRHDQTNGRLTTANGRRRLQASLLLTLAVAGLVTGCNTLQTATFILPEYQSIKLDTGLKRLIPDIGPIEAPAFSHDASRIAFEVEDYRDPWLPYEIHSIAFSQKDGAGQWTTPTTIFHGRYKPFWGRMDTAVQPSFDADGRHLFITHVSFNSGFGIPWVNTLRSTIERIPLADSPGQILIDHTDWGHHPNELLQHARVSPDGRFLAFYTKEHEQGQGVYLLDLKTKAKFRLSHTLDKHPTWSSDGRRIYFHHVEGGQRGRLKSASHGVERSVLGFFDMNFVDGRLVDWRRRLMDPMTDGEYVYHKHVTEVPGTGLLVFHGKVKPTGKKRLMVRTTDPGSEVFVLKPRWQGHKLAAAKHPCSSFEQQNVAFVARAKGEKTYRLLLDLTPAAIEEIRQAVIAHGE